MSSKPFEHVVIVGAGLLGTSLGMALKRRGLAKWVTGVGRAGSRSVEVAKGRGAVDEGTTDVVAAVTGDGMDVSPADLVVLCVPILQFAGMMRLIAPALKAGAIVTDVGSTKGQVMAWAAELLPAESFVGSHPMAGSEKSGPEAAREDLYEGAVCLMCKANAGNAIATGRAKELWQAVGMRVLEMASAMEHDRWVAAISHLPHAVAYALVNAAAKEPPMLEAVAGGFMDSTRVASSDVTMWTDIFLTNREAVLEAIDLFAGELGKLRGAIERGDEGAIRATLESARKTRDELVARRADKRRRE